MNAFDFESAGLTPAGDDAVVPFAVEALDVRGRAVQLGPALNSILDRHAYPAPVSRLLAETIALVALLGSSLKFQGRFILQTQTDGPVSMLVVDFASPDSLRAYAQFDAEKVAAAQAAGTLDAPSLLGHGHLAMTIDQGAHMNRYQGLVALDGIGLEEVAHRYFAQSEQIPTIVRLAVGEVFDRREGRSPAHSWRAGGVLVQFLPEAPERMRQPDIDPGDAPADAVKPEIEVDDAWVEARALAETVKDAELTDPSLPAEQLLFRLFHERGVRIFQSQGVVDKCQCSRERIETVLSSFSREEREDMTVDGKIIASCQFCGESYDFDPSDYSGEEAS